MPRWFDNEDDVLDEEPETTGCIFPGGCCMPGEHFPSECCRAAMMEGIMLEQMREDDKA